MRELSILLGAGFSIPKGYPSGAKLNELISNFDPKKYTIGTAYELMELEEGQKDIFWYSSHNVYKHFLYEMISFYKSYFEFDYEEFYDFLQDPKNFKEVDKEFDLFFSDFSQKYKRDDFSNLIYNTTKIYNKLIPYYIKDENGDSYYEPIHYSKPTYPTYGNFLNLLEKLGQDYDIVHVHTLNHDVYFEVFNSTAWINGQLSDGFQELGSPYYGVVKGFKNITHKVRLPFYSANYKTKFRLYKLHGSIDYFPMHNSLGQIETFLKSAPGVDYMDFSKEVNIGGELEYHSDWLNLHPDFLSGTNSKILRYKEPAYYGRVFQLFENNLNASESVLIIGYGFKDSEINELLIKYSKKFHYRPIIFDPFPTGTLEQTSDKINGKIIRKGVEEIELSDLN